MPLWKGVIEEFKEFLPVSDATPIISMGEGGTPLIKSDRLSRLLRAEVYLKFEGANPTGSFKDRGMTLAISKALEGGAEAVVCASTGNTSASASAYAALAGMKSAVLIPQGNVAMGKLAQALAHGAKVIEVKGNFDQALEITRKLEEAYPVTLVNSINPYRIDGQKTAAFEIADALGASPDIQCIPVGNAGNITSHHRGYQELLSRSSIDKLPRMFGFQADGAAPIVRGYPIDAPKTIATAIRIGNPASWEGATKAAVETGGQIRSVRDKEILEAYRDLSRYDGIFCELASAASVAGLLQIADEGLVENGSTVVCVLTGHGLKDPRWAIAGAPSPPLVEPDVEAVAEAMEL